jgi:hypothetical protein
VSYHTKLIIKIPLTNGEFDPDTVINEIDACNVDLVGLVKANFENVELAVEIGD